MRNSRKMKLGQRLRERRMMQLGFASMSKKRLVRNDRLKEMKNMCKQQISKQ